MHNRPCRAFVSRPGTYDSEYRVLKVAVVHYWLVGMRGGERVLEQILTCFPEADLFTHVFDPSAVSPLIRDRRVTESFIGKFPGARKHYQKYLQFMPRALEELDVSDYDLVLSSESGPAKGVIAGPEARHLCYCHSPMRYIYDHYPAYRAPLGRLKRAYFSHLAHRLRMWDFVSAARVDRFVANSSFVRARIRRVYGRDADVIHPPVDLETYSPIPAPGRDYYLCVSELVGYKRVDLAIEAVRGTNRVLRVVGDGEAAEALRRNAPANVEFLGRVEADRMREIYGSAKALLFPGEEDFGIVPVEAMACGTPVIAYGSGGARDSVRDGVTGLFFDAQSAPAMRTAIERFEAMDFPVEPIARHAEGFSPENFRQQFTAAVGRMMEEAR